MKLTARQQQVLEVIRQYVADTGYPPTRADIAHELGFKSANAAEEHLRAQQEAMRSNSLQQFHPLQEVEIPYTDVENLQNMKSSNLNPRSDCFYPKSQ